MTEASLKYLNLLAESHSKSARLTKSKLKCEDYITDKRFSVDEVQLLFRLRTKTDSSKRNFKNQYAQDMSCDLCRIELCTTEHLLSCIVIKKFIPEIDNTSVVYEDIYSDVNKQLAAVKLFVKIFKQKEIILEAMGK